MNVDGARYRKLPGRSINFFGGRSRLWLAEDHLLEVSGMMLAERYRRFPLVDIRALVIETTRTRLIGLWVYGVAFIVGAGVSAFCTWRARQLGFGLERAFEVGMYWAGAVIAGIVAVVALIGLILVLARGATCRCFVQTSAGLLALAAPTRWRGARRVLAVLVPEIEAAQNGTVSAGTSAR